MPLVDAEDDVLTIRLVRKPDGRTTAYVEGHALPEALRTEDALDALKRHPVFGPIVTSGGTRVGATFRETLAHLKSVGALAADGRGDFYSDARRAQIASVEGK